MASPRVVVSDGCHRNAPSSTTGASAAIPARLSLVVVIDMSMPFVLVTDVTDFC